MVKSLPTVRKGQVQSLGWEAHLEEGMTTHSSILAWKNPVDWRAWGLAGYSPWDGKESDTTKQLTLLLSFFKCPGPLDPQASSSSFLPPVCFLPVFLIQAPSKSPHSDCGLCPKPVHASGSGYLLGQLLEGRTGLRDLSLGTAAWTKGSKRGFGLSRRCWVMGLLPNQGKTIQHQKTINKEKKRKKMKTLPTQGYFDVNQWNQSLNNEYEWQLKT